MKLTKIDQFDFIPESELELLLFQSQSDPTSPLDKVVKESRSVCTPECGQTSGLLTASVT